MTSSNLKMFIKNVRMHLDRNNFGNVYSRKTIVGFVLLDL